MVRDADDEVYQNWSNYIREFHELSNPLEEIRKVYKYLKEIIPHFYENGEVSWLYKYLIQDLRLDCERYLPEGFIVPSVPNIKSINELGKTDEEILDFIVAKTREYLMETEHEYESILDCDFTGDCIKSSDKVEEICNNFGIKNYKKYIYPGFSVKYRLSGNTGYHYFNIIELNNKFYLIDPTYRQFFTIHCNDLNRIGIPYLLGCKAGTFMLMKDERMKIATKILSNGWIELDEKVLKNYLDGFALSYRNGIYYEKTNDFSFETNYSHEDYINFLTGKDNQVNHEGEESLGFQTRPSKILTFN